MVVYRAETGSVSSILAPFTTNVAVAETVPKGCSAWSEKPETWVRLPSVTQKYTLAQWRDQQAATLYREV